MNWGFLLNTCVPIWLALLVWSSSFAVERQPNIVVILADDLGWSDVGFHGSDIQTPNIDELAQGGARLDRFYALPMCTPTRASLLTGRYPFRYGLQTAAIPADASYGLSLSEYLLPQMLRRAGYATAILGKWHLGHADRKYWPKNRGFDVQYGPLVGEIDYYTHSVKGKRDWYDNHVPFKEEGYATELIGRRAEQTVLQHDVAKPLFLYLAFTAPHAPYQTPAEYERQYSDIEDPTRRAYAAMITCMDEQIGKVIAALERKKLRENTLVFFMSDNGGNRISMFSGEGDVSDLELPASNQPYRGGKGTLLEGGCRVVAVANWPHKIKPSTIAEPMHVVDLLPTLVGLGNATTKGAKPLDGIDQWDLIRSGTNSPRSQVVYNIEPYRAAISRGKWKLIVKTSIPPISELYDLEADPSEKVNVADRYDHVVDELRNDIFRFSKDARPPLFFDYALKHSEHLRELMRTFSKQRTTD